ILRAAPKAVLWLLSGGDAADQNLREHAMAQNIEPDRLVFAPRKHNAEHLARYPLADLFLDTAPYGAHTTASDAMWMGVPVITTPGRSFASRVCASLVRAAGLPELACSTHQEYVQRAIALANDPVGTKMFKERLAAGRGACTLFDTLGLVRSLEGLYAQMWAEFEEGRLPRPDLANLELYHDIACRFSHADEQEPFERKYLAALAYQHAVSPVRPDSRLWTETATPT
ncbi:MAG: glycosyl transferase, partial [Acetobacteraceae bacterium]|nr:glycosyl transferase [Acetobacteraceae bacterium]